MIGCNVFDLVHPLDHRELRDVTGNWCPTSLNKSTASCNHKLFIRMMTKGHLSASRSYRVCCSTFCYVLCEYIIAVLVSL